MNDVFDEKKCCEKQFCRTGFLTQINIFLRCRLRG